ncbi:hypothetical protein TRVA0_025S01068 [Trichomonascus vanleenenianus]|uniref:DSC4 family protein n=1 Tax=Trichomonascus vanleenenianus TaxID=2268995 RepID=UPI003ECB1808
MADLASQRKKFFNSHLCHSLDILVCTQLIIIYLHDISTFRLLFGVVIQLSLLSPKFATIPMPFPAHFDKRYIIFTILGYNVLCLLIHSLSYPPQATSGHYLHGGLTIEFIGDRELHSRVPLILWDLIVMVLQFSLFSIHYHCKSGSEDSNSPSSSSSNGGDYDLAYTGALVIQDISIYDAIIENWRHPLVQDDDQNQDVRNELTDGLV